MIKKLLDEFHEDENKRKTEVIQNPGDPAERDEFRAVYSEYEDTLGSRATNGQCVIDAIFFYRIFH